MTVIEDARAALADSFNWQRQQDALRALIAEHERLDLQVTALVEWTGKLHERGWRAEKAITDDEREALDPQRDALKHSLRNVTWTETGELLGYIPEGTLGMYADAILAAGFRRQSVTEPSLTVSDDEVTGAAVREFAHCRRDQNGLAPAHLTGPAWGEMVPVCHPDEELDCQSLVTVHGERLGARRHELISEALRIVNAVPIRADHSTHHDECWKVHVDCLALQVRAALEAAEAVPGQDSITDEWEYGYRAPGCVWPAMDYVEAVRYGRADPTAVDLVRRRKAGPWEPVEAAREGQ